MDSGKFDPRGIITGLFDSLTALIGTIPRWVYMVILGVLGALVLLFGASLVLGKGPPPEPEDPTKPPGLAAKPLEFGQDYVGLKIIDPWPYIRGEIPEPLYPPLQRWGIREMAEYLPDLEQLIIESIRAKNRAELEEILQSGP